MKEFFLATLCLMALVVPSSAIGPDGKTVAATLAGTAVPMQNPLSMTKTRIVYAECATSGFTMSAWRYDTGQATWNWVSFGSGVTSPDTVHVVQDYILPIEGKFDLLFFKSDAATATIDLHIYSE